MSKNDNIRTGKFKGMDRKEVLELIRRNGIHNNRKKNRKNKAIDQDLVQTYGKWQSVSDTKRSFFLWKGKHSSSPKEKEISDILSGMNLRFFREISFDLKKRFDFYIPLIDLVIEYDGVQHFKFLKEINNDKIKETILNRLGVKYIRYNRTHDLKTQIAHDLVHHPILLKNASN